ncbi:hypothetical protein [Nocardia neocaledoniensis]|uniref:hypothetical protein n=1 Tax=Nocardia neocaledoniensis TaxID=236511 RepID=UPI001FC98073|nr:hypothetical protein [Nocardia neocaledoniensis]
MTHRVGDGEQHPRRRCAELAGAVREGEHVEECDEPFGEALGQHSPDLSRGCLVRGVLCRRQSGSAAEDQAEQDGQCFVVAEHERRQSVSGREAVAAVSATH